MPKQKYWDGTAWQEVGASGNKVTIADSGNLITATNAEDALQELITKINTNTNNISNLPKIFTATGTATAILVTTGFFNLINNQTFTFKASANNNGSATTINADAKGVRSVYKPNTTTPPTFIAGKAYTVWYDTTNVCFFIKASAEGTAVVGDVLAGTTFSNDNDTGLAGTLALTGNATTADVLANKTFYNTNAKSKQTGGIPIKSTATITPSTVAQTIAAGQYLGGDQTISSVGGNATAPTVLEGNTFSSDSAGRAIAGTMPNQGVKVITPNTENQAIVAGYHNGSGYVAGSPNLIESNIKSGVNIFGKVGILQERLVYKSSQQYATITDLQNITLSCPFIPDYFRIVVRSVVTPSASSSRKIYFSEWAIDSSYIIDPATSTANGYYWSQDELIGSGTYTVVMKIDNWNAWTDGDSDGIYTNSFRFNTSGTLSNHYVDLLAIKGL